MEKIKLKKIFNNAIELGKARNYTESAKLFLEVIKKGNDIPEAYLFLGRCYHSLNRMEEAVQVLKHYLTLSPDSPSGNFFLGRSLLSMELSGKAVYYLRKAVEAHPESTHANGFLGIAYLKSGRSDFALN
ncbi:MAG: tetratricopeptide repeat protein, partial [Spirochaetales bacterium]|nr:tetratricopeptide repeat protein [Spirochaetales bacterium]